MAGKPGEVSGSRRPAAFSLIMVLVIVGAAFLTLAGVLLWSSASARMSQRHSELYTSQAGAEAATENVIAKISSDFRQPDGRATVDANEASYTSLVPSDPVWANYDFSSPGGVPVYVTRASNWSWGPLNWKYSGMMTSNVVYRIIANARDTTSAHQVTAAVLQDIQLAYIPVFSYFAFYDLDLEFGMNSGDWNVNAPVHANAGIYLHPHLLTLTFLDNVTASGQILYDKRADDCYSGSLPPYSGVVFQREHDAHVNALRLSTGMSPTNLWGYYKGVAGVSGLTIEITGNNPLDVLPGGALLLSPANVTNFIRTDRQFMDKRENDLSEHMRVTEFDVKAYTNTAIFGGMPPNVVYIADLRPDTATEKHAVRVVNGQILPAGGLTLATPNPLYVLGDFNAPNPGTTNTSSSKPASLAADAITVLSGLWIDANSSNALSGRVASSTTVNAALLTGIVPTSAGNGPDCYSGGIENVMRFVENWAAAHINFNGSIVVPFASQFATGPWRPSGAVGGDVYEPPARTYRFDQNYADPAKLPLATPFLRTLIRSQWKLLAPGATS